MYMFWLHNKITYQALYNNQLSTLTVLGDMYVLYNRRRLSPQRPVTEVIWVEFMTPEKIYDVNFKPTAEKLVFKQWFYYIPPLTPLTPAAQGEKEKLAVVPRAK